MSTKFLYCEKCEDLVPESEVIELPRLDISVIKKEVKVKTLDEKTQHHQKCWTENFYNNAGTGRIGYCPVQRKELCGKVREPTDQEYFIHFTCNPKRNKDADRRTEKAPEPEQLAIVEQWEEERKEREVLYDDLSAAEKAGDLVKFKEIVKQLGATTSDRCPHDRSIWSSCAGCEEIERLMNPERYCSKCEEELDEEEVPFVQGMCDYCSQRDDDE